MGKLRHQMESALAEVTDLSNGKAGRQPLACHPEVLASSWRGRDGGGKVTVKLLAPGFHSTVMPWGDEPTHSCLLSTYHVPAPV